MRKETFNTYQMSYFDAPIAPQKNTEGKLITPATLVPRQTVTAEAIYRFITQSEWLREMTLRVRSAADVRAAKAALLPYVTPYGVFSRRNGRSLLTPSGLIPVDFDHLPSEEEARRVQRLLFDDVRLGVVLCFVSPGGKGVKAFVPSPQNPGLKPEENLQANITLLNRYLQVTFPDLCDGSRGSMLDTCGKDVARACFLCNDEQAMFRHVRLL